MVYGRLLFNNIKQYTPKWFKTIPYSQTIKPTFRRKKQVIYGINNSAGAKLIWKGLRNTLGQYAWSWSLLIFAISFGYYYSMYYPFIAVYRYNNQNRTYAAAYAVEKAHKKKKEALEALQQLASTGAIEAQQNILTTPEDFIDNEENESEVQVDQAKREDLRKKKLISLVNKIIKQQKEKKLVQEYRKAKNSAQASPQSQNGDQKQKPNESVSQQSSADEDQ